MILPEAVAIAVFDVLVEVCGASPCQREEFLFSLTRRNTEEFRFGGSLDFGGKFWSDRGKVNCYPEHETPARVAVIQTANQKIHQIYQAHQLTTSG